MLYTFSCFTRYLILNPESKTIVSILWMKKRNFRVITGDPLINDYGEFKPHPFLLEWTLSPKIPPQDFSEVF